mmetsp:Transcript_37137/g.115535  ORF Transcript_37137/g.115535 Transcript_37137/m.115535 type:complete len:95 (-) Transcript_37137:223-507(-)
MLATAASVFFVERDREAARVLSRSHCRWITALSESMAEYDSDSGDSGTLAGWTQSQCFFDESDLQALRAVSAHHCFAVDSLLQAVLHGCERQFA